MSANNQIGSGAVVISASADPLVAGLTQSKAKIDAWGVQAQASIKASTGGLSSMMAQAWEKSNDTLASKMQAAWARQREASRLMAISAPKDDAFLAGLDKAHADVQQWAEKTQRHLDTKGLDLGGKRGGKNGGGKIGVLKGLKLGEAGELGLTGAMVSLGVAVANAFSTQAVDQFNTAMERSKQIAGDLEDAMSKADAARLDRIKGGSVAEIDAMMKSAKLSKDGMEQELNRLREKQREMQSSDSRYVAKGTLGWIGAIGDRFETEERELKEGLDAADKRLRRHREYLEQLEKTKAAMLAGVARQYTDPLVKGLDDALTKGKEFFGLIVGNSAAIRKETEATIKSLREEHDLMGLDPGATAVQKAKDGGETDPNKLAEIRLRAEANERKKATLAIDEQIKAMQLEAAVYGMTSEQAKRHQMVLAGATADQLKQFDDLAQKARALKEGIEAAMAPKLAGAVLAGGQEDYAVNVRMQGFDIGDGNAIHKENGVKLDKILEANKAQAKDIADMRGAVIKLEGF